MEQTDMSETGRRLGHDLYRFRHAVERRTAQDCLVEGWTAAEARKLPRTSPDRFVNKWLQLRVGAFKRGRVVDEAVTPAFLRIIDVPRCPITGVVLTHGALLDSDWSIDRLNNDGGYAPRNLAVMSVRANRAKGRRSFDEVLALARLDAPAGGLTRDEWMRMASFMLGACCAGQPAAVPLIPLAAPVAPRTVMPGVQVVQYVFTAGLRSMAAMSALVRCFGRVCPDEPSRRRLERFAMLMHQERKRVDLAFDAWLQPALMGAFEAWHRTLGTRSRAEAAELARQLADGHLVERFALESWQLGQRGYVQ